MKILVTGANGYIGLHIVKTLLDKGIQVIACDLNTDEVDKRAERKNIDLFTLPDTNIYTLYGEWPYKNIKPRIIAEQYIEDKKSHELYDYKFFCFNGKVKLFKIDFDRFTEHHANYYTPTGEILPLVETAYPPQFDRIISMPSTLPQMISLAETLSCGIPFLRVDFYTIGMDIFFGELTFFPTSGMTPFEPKDWDKKLGDMLILPTKNK